MHSMYCILIHLTAMFIKISNQRSLNTLFSTANYDVIAFQNILIGDDGSPLLTDFGSVRLADVTVSNRKEVHVFGMYHTRIVF